MANIQSQLSHLPSPGESPPFSSPSNTIDINDSPLPPLPLSPSHSYLSFPNASFLHPPDPYDPFSYPDSTYSINQWDTWLNSSDSPPPQPFEPVNNTNRIAVPPPITKSPNPTLASPNSPFALANQESRVSALDEKGIQRKPSIQLPDMPPIRPDVSSKHTSVSGVASLSVAPNASSVNPVITHANPMNPPNASRAIPLTPLPSTLRRMKRRKRGKEDDELYEEAPGKKEETPIKRRRGRPVRESVVTDDQRKVPEDSDEKRQYQKPKWCHQCKARKRDVIQCCGEGKPRGANNQM